MVKKKLKIKIPNSLETLYIESKYKYTIENLTQGNKFKIIRLVSDEMENKITETEVDYLLNTLKTNFIKEGKNSENYYNLDLQIPWVLNNKIGDSKKNRNRI